MLDLKTRGLKRKEKIAREIKNPGKNRSNRRFFEISGFKQRHGNRGTNLLASCSPWDLKTESSSIISDSFRILALHFFAESIHCMAIWISSSKIQKIARISSSSILLSKLQNTVVLLVIWNIHSSIAILCSIQEADIEVYCCLVHWRISTFWQVKLKAYLRILTGKQALLF
jgi:hypothetical protein